MVFFFFCEAPPIAAINKTKQQPNNTSVMARSVPLTVVMMMMLAASVGLASAFAPNIAAGHQRQRRAAVDTQLRYTSGDYLSSLAGRTSAPPPDNNNYSTYKAPEPEPSSSAAVTTATVVAAAAPTPATSAVVVHTPAQEAPPPTAAVVYRNSYPTSNGQSTLFLPKPPPALEMGDRPEAFSYASRSSFAIDLLESKGPRDNVDVGQPHEASRPLVNDLGGTVSVGSWWCSEGGWPSLSPRSTTEVFHVLSGHGCLTDMDGMRHFFGPGDTVILPKGWAGRWDIQEAVHKVYCINAHARIEDTASPIIRAVTIPHHELSAPEVLVRAAATRALVVAMLFSLVGFCYCCRNGPSNGMMRIDLPIFFTFYPLWHIHTHIIRTECLYIHSTNTVCDLTRFTASPTRPPNWFIVSVHRQWLVVGVVHPVHSPSIN
jgi:uncharacterized cupin superfamily protein